MKLKIVTQISNDVDYHCITFDMWTLRSLHCFMSLTLHFINKNTWKLETLNLGAYPFEGAHGSGEIADKIKILLDEWELPFEKLVAISCDNAS